MDADMELSVTKFVEIVFEAIPGTLLQTFKLLQSGGDGEAINKVALGSVLISALTTGFSCAIISFDWDADPARRKAEPGFYGYIPDSAGRRTAIFFCMAINGALLLLARSTSTALLALVGQKWVLLYYVADMVLYLGYKILRRDFWHWVPLEGFIGVAQSFVVRVCVKTIADFTGVLQLRAPGEVGGAWFTMNLVRRNPDAVALALTNSTSARRS
jgi:hypothetical protein